MKLFNASADSVKCTVHDENDQVVVLEAAPGESVDVPDYLCVPLIGHNGQPGAPRIASIAPQLQAKEPDAPEAAAPKAKKGKL